ncbi:MAG: dNTP triphosphohydrolase [Acidimicrobiaceae bacterium]|nr:dNTP triphosphohydrolase [Acidimicrobiaceae bacterium]
MYSDSARLRRMDDTNPGLADKKDRKRDNRNPFAKDRDRLYYATALHRLDGKSQVVASTEIGPFHTRLAHTLKVAQLGRRLAESFRAQVAEERGLSEQSSLTDPLAPDPDLVEFACLAHDIGHPPFGHAGERALNAAVDDLVSEAVNGDQGKRDAARARLGGFQGNAQSLRIVTRLSHKWLDDDGLDDRQYPNHWYGLDVTAASMDVMSKYPWAREDVLRKQWGAYTGEQNPSASHVRWDGSDVIALNWARRHTGAPVAHKARQSFECELMDWCDDVTYAVHDVEDFYMIGMIPLDRIFGPAPRMGVGGRGANGQDILSTAEWEEFREYVFGKWSKKWSEDDDRQGPLTRGYLDDLRAGLMSAASGFKQWPRDRQSSLGRRASHFRTSSLIEYFTEELEYEGTPMLHEGNLLLSSSADRRTELRDQCNLLKELPWKYVIDLPNLTTQQAGQATIIRELVKIYAGDKSLMPPYLRELIEQGGAGYSEADGSVNESIATIRVAADYVASLTETHAIALHKRLTGADLGAFRDLV